MTLFADLSWKEMAAGAELYRYEFDSGGFEECQDHGVWVCISAVSPIQCERLTDLPAVISAAGAHVEFVHDLAAKAAEFYSFETGKFLTDKHVSMVRMSNLPHWAGTPGLPAVPPRL